MRRRVLLSALAAGLLACLPLAGAGAGPSCEVSGVERVVAIGDVHGAYDRFAEILQITGLVDADLHWTGGKTHLVQVGDVVDRGPDSRKALDLLRSLVDPAARAGGRVHALIGNHEVMRILGDMRYVTPGEYQAFVTDGSEALRERFVNTTKADARADLRAKTPLGWVEMRLAFGGDGPYGKWLDGLNAVVKINDVIFLHGGISPSVAGLSCMAINDTVRRELTADLEKTLDDPQRSLAAREDGPLWYRGLAQGSDLAETEVDEILAKQGAKAIVVGHTVAPTGRIVSRFGGKVFQIDTGMQPAYVSGGRAAALEYKGAVYTAIYTDRQDPLPDTTRP